jgi:cytochrome c553
MIGFRAAVLLCAALLGACAGAVTPRPDPSGELIAVGGGPGGAADACFTCHGLNGEGDGLAPRLAGLDAGYMTKQLQDYVIGVRPHDTMTPIARRLSDGERLAVSAYYAALPAPPPRNTGTPLAIAARLYRDGDPARGLRACADCHGETGAGLRANPKIARQPAPYVAEQLHRWKRAVRRNDAGDVMGRAARALSDAEIEALAVYVASLEG